MRNKYPGTCLYCGDIVEAGKGHFEKVKGRKENVIHGGCMLARRSEKQASCQHEVVFIEHKTYRGQQFCMKCLKCSTNKIPRKELKAIRAFLIMARGEFENKKPKAQERTTEGVETMAKLEIAVLVGAESKQFLFDLTKQIDRLEALSVSGGAATNATPSKEDSAAEKKAAAAKAKAAKEAAAKAAEEAASAEETTATEDDDLGLDLDADLASEPKKTTLADVREVVKKFAAKHGKANTLKMLAKFGATAIPEIKEKDFDKVIEICNKHLKA